MEDEMDAAELTLDEMLSDEIVRLVMTRDGIVENDVRAVMMSLNRHRGRRNSDTPTDPLSRAA